MARARLLAVLATLVAGAVGIISSTQTWLAVTLADGADHDLLVPGATAIPVLAPLSLATLALGLALAIAGRVLRYVFGALALAIGATLLLLTWQVAASPTASHVAGTVTEATGIAGLESIAALVASVAVTPWPYVTLVAWIVLCGAGVFTLATAHAWRGAGRRYRTATEADASRGATSRPHDAVRGGAVDDWDDLSRGTDPTAAPR